VRVENPRLFIKTTACFLLFTISAKRLYNTLEIGKSKFPPPRRVADEATLSGKVSQFLEDYYSNSTSQARLFLLDTSPPLTERSFPKPALRPRFPPKIPPLARRCSAALPSICLNDGFLIILDDDQSQVKKREKYSHFRGNHYFRLATFDFFPKFPVLPFCYLAMNKRNFLGKFFTQFVKNTLRKKYLRRENKAFVCFLEVSTNQIDVYFFLSVWHFRPRKISPDRF